MNFDPECRKLGIAGKLMRYDEALARKKKYKSLKPYTWEKNFTAKAVHKKVINKQVVY